MTSVEKPDAWKERIHNAISAAGFEDVTSFSKKHRDSTFRQIARMLGDEVAPIEIEKLLREEALKTGTPNEFARDCLFRYLRQCLPQGWGKGETAGFDAARAFASWTAALSLSANDNVDCAARKVWNNINESVAEGWLPRDSDDEQLISSFENVSFDLEPQ